MVKHKSWVYIHIRCESSHTELTGTLPVSCLAPNLIANCKFSAAWDCVFWSVPRLIRLVKVGWMSRVQTGRTMGGRPWSSVSCSQTTIRSFSTVRVCLWVCFWGCVWNDRMHEDDEDLQPDTGQADCRTFPIRPYFRVCLCNISLVSFCSCFTNKPKELNFVPVTYRKCPFHYQDVWRPLKFH